MEREQIEHYIDNIEYDTKRELLLSVLELLLRQKNVNDLKDKQDINFIELAINEFNRDYPKKKCVCFHDLSYHPKADECIHPDCSCNCYQDA